MLAQDDFNIAKNNLSKATDSYARIQKQLDRYNKVFESYANASPSTQVRAASVMRQAINEYNSLKSQQQENALKIYEAQSWIDYYNNNQDIQQAPIQRQIVQVVNSGAPINTITEIEQPKPVEEIPIVTTTTPGKLNNNNTATIVEKNAIDDNNTSNVINTPTGAYFSNLNNQNKISSTTPIGVTRYISKTTPKYQNTTIKAPEITYTPTGTYGPGTSMGLNNNTLQSQIYNLGRSIPSTGGVSLSLRKAK